MLKEQASYEMCGVRRHCSNMGHLHQFAIAIGIDVPVTLFVEVYPKILGIDQIAVVRKRNSVRAVHVEGLSLSTRAAASSGVSQVSQAHETGKVLYSGPVMEDLGCHAIAFALVDPSARGASSNPRRILSSMLKVVKGIVKIGSRSRGGGVVEIAENESEDSTHLDRYEKEGTVEVKLMQTCQLEQETVFQRRQARWGRLFSQNMLSSTFTRNLEV